MPVTTKALYDTDFVEWANEAVELLRQRRFAELDLENLIEEVEDLARSQQEAVRSQLRRLLMHLIKRTIQPEKATGSRIRSIANARAQIRDKLETSPSLRRYLEGARQRAYELA